MLKWIKHWYNGETEMDDPIIEPGLVIVPAPYTQYHWTAKIARSVVSFYLAHWQWIWGTVIAIASLFVTIANLKGT